MRVPCKWLWIWHSMQREAGSKSSVSSLRIACYCGRSAALGPPSNEATNLAQS
jgi:hypothetical protein